MTMLRAKDYSYKALSTKSHGCNMFLMNYSKEKVLSHNSLGSHNPELPRFPLLM